MNKTDLYKLIDALPEKEIHTAAAFLSFVTLRAKQSPLDIFLDSAPYEDEELTPEERAGIEEGLADIKAGRTYTMEEVEKELLG